VPDSLIDLAGPNVNAGDFLAAVLEAAAQPIWVVDPGAVIRFANPAALAALGYESAQELSGRGSHEAIHHHHHDGTPYPAEDCRMLLPRATGEVVESDLDWFFRRDGSMFSDRESAERAPKEHTRDGGSKEPECRHRAPTAVRLIARPVLRRRIRRLSETRQSGRRAHSRLHARGADDATDHHRVGERPKRAPRSRVRARGGAALG
jgi:PAS domain S-box-containing protein